MRSGKATTLRSMTEQRKHPINPETGLPQTSRQAAWPYPVESAPFTMSYQILVEAPALELWELMANPHRHHEIDGSGTLKQKTTGPEQLAVGDTFNISMSLKGLPYTLKMTTTRSEPGRIIEWQHPGKHYWRWEFSPAPDNPEHTLVTETFDYSETPPLMIRMFKAGKIFEGNSRGIQSSLSRMAEKYLYT